MRAALLTLTIAATLFLAHSRVWAFDCFETPDGKRRCACLGATTAAKCANRENANQTPNAITPSLALSSVVARPCGLERRALACRHLVRGHAAS